MRARLTLVVGLILATALRPSPASAQLETFVQGVRDLAAASALAEPARATAVQAAAQRMGAALGEWDRTIASLEARVERERRRVSDQDAARLHIGLGVAYRARGRIADALRAFDAALALQPSASDLQVLRALTLETAGRSAEAASAFRSAFALDRGNAVKAYYTIRRAGAGGSERGPALAVLTSAYRRLATDVSPPTAAPFVSLDAIPDTLWRTPVVGDDATGEAFAHLAAGRYDDAVAALTRPDGVRRPATNESPLAGFARGQVDEAENRVAEARRAYQAALTGTLLGRAVLYVGLARLAQVDGDAAGAIDAFSRAVVLNPNDPNVRRELASAYAAQSQPDDAFAELMAALIINPRDAQTHAAIGGLYLDAGRDAEAVTALTRALALAPERYEARYALARALTRLGKTREATEQLALFERVRGERLEQRRRDIAGDVAKEEAIRGGRSTQDTPR